ncbi:MAG: GHMP kinase, partial [Schleiferiaceae bacterium]
MAQPRSFFARGKLLLTGEYAVVQGAEALAIPTVKGQHLTYHPGDGPLHWTALEADGSTWLSGDVATESELSLVRSCIEAALKLQGSSTWPTGSVVTQVEFERSWGWGTSSTLIALIAQWLD